MNWLWVILIVAAIGGIIGYLNTGKKEEAAASAIAAGTGCAGIIFQIFIFIVGILLVFKLGSWLFG